MSNLENDLVDGIGDMPDEEEFEQPKEASADSLRILEAILFASDELLTTARLKTILPDNPDAREIGRMVEKINRQLQNERHPFEVVEIGGGYQFKTVAYYHPWVRQIFKEKVAKRLSIQALECLSIIAYRQPLSKAEIEAIRGVISDGAMKTLLEKRLVTITGRSEKVGRPLLYGTTPEFLKYFGLNKISDLPQIEEFEAMVREKMDSMGLEELKNVQTQAAQKVNDEASIEIAMPSEPAESGASSPSGQETSSSDTAEVFEATAQEEAPVEHNAAPSHGTVMEAETVLQPVVKEDRNNADAVAEEKPVISVKRKKGKKASKKEREEHAEETVLITDTQKADSDGEAVFEAAAGTQEPPPQEPVETPDAENDAIVFESPIVKKEEPVPEPVDTHPNVEAASPAGDDDVVFEVAAESMNPEETTIFSKDALFKAGTHGEEKTAPKKNKPDDDAIFEVKM
jgi:segregation and condensation protein B